MSFCLIVLSSQSQKARQIPFWKWGEIQPMVHSEKEIEQNRSISFKFHDGQKNNWMRNFLKSVIDQKYRSNLNEKY
jgi:hypothetical protein